MGAYLGVDAHSRYNNVVIPGPLSTFNVRVREDLKIYTNKRHSDMGKYSTFWLLFLQTFKIQCSPQHT